MYGISLFRLLSENRTFLHSKISYFCIFFAKIDVLNTNRTPATNHLVLKAVDGCGDAAAAVDEGIAGELIHGHDGRVA